MAGTKWAMHWQETKVFDINAVGLGCDELELMTSAGKSLASLEQCAGRSLERGDLVSLWARK